MPFNYFTEPKHKSLSAPCSPHCAGPRWCLRMFQVCPAFPGEREPASTACARFLYDIIHPSGRSLLANTQVPIICSKCVILASVALFPGRADGSHAVICALLPHPAPPPRPPQSTMSSQLGLRFGTGPSETVEKYAKLHNASLQSLAPTARVPRR